MSPLQSLIASGTKLWIDSIDPDLVKRDRASGATGATSNPVIISDLIRTGRFDADIQRLVKQGLAEQGIELLHNQGVLLNDGQLLLAGVDDLWSGEPDAEAALANWREGVPTILLAHEPDFADQFLADGRIQLQLSGHTHGGQVRMPGVGPLVLPRYGQKYHNGLYRVGQGQVYTNRGIGVIDPAVRLNCPPEITEFVLRTV